MERVVQLIATISVDIRVLGLVLIFFLRRAMMAGAKALARRSS